VGGGLRSISSSDDIGIIGLDGGQGGSGINITGGHSNDSPGGSGGNINVTAGHAEFSGTAGQVTLTGGTGYGSVVDGGTVTLKGGDHLFGHPNGNGGQVRINGGNTNSDSGVGGNIILTPGTGSGGSGINGIAQVVGSMTITGIVRASTFNAVGSAYQVNGVTVIDSNRNIFSGSSITASSFYGDGANLTGIASGGESNTFYSSKTFISTVTVYTDIEAYNKISGGTRTLSLTNPWQTFNTTTDGSCSGAIITTNVGRWSLIGKTLFVTLDAQCTSTGTNFRISLPFPAQNSVTTAGGCWLMDNGVWLLNFGSLATNAGSTGVDIYTAANNGNGFTALGTKRIICTFTAEIQ